MQPSKTEKSRKSVFGKVHISTVCAVTTFSVNISASFIMKLLQIRYITSHSSEKAPKVPQLRANTVPLPPNRTLSSWSCLCFFLLPSTTVAWLERGLLVIGASQELSSFPCLKCEAAIRQSARSSRARDCTTAIGCWVC